MDIFQFKRCFEDVRRKLARYLKEQHSRVLLDDPTFLPQELASNASNAATRSDPPWL